MQIPAHILKKVKLLEIKTRKLVNNVLAGEYHTVFKGQGMTFAEFREYVPGDDIRRISWTLTAKAGKPFIKKFDEERELTMILAVDISGSTGFGSKEYLKAEVITFVSALLGFAAEKNKDQIGLLLFSDKIEHFVPPAKGRGQIFRILRDLFYVKPQSQGTDLGVAFHYLLGILKKRSTIFILSDFFGQNYEKSLRQLARKHDVAACIVSDPMELLMPSLGLVDLQDAETGEMKTVDTSSSNFKESFKIEQKTFFQQRDKWIRQSGVDRIILSTDKDYAEPLVQFFKRKKTRS